MTIRYTSDRNGFSGVLYGNRSMSIFDPQGHEVLHTGFRAVNTMEGLKQVVDGADRLIECLAKWKEADDDQRTGD